jgi:hypothetical protein
MCSIFNSCWKRDKSQPDIQTQGQIQGQQQINNIKISRGDSLPSKDYNLYLVQKNIQQLLDLQKIQMDYLKEIEKLHNKKDE